METPLRSTSLTRSKHLKETSRKDTNPATSHTIGGKIIMTTFWRCQGVLLVDFISLGTTVNGSYYASVLCRLPSSIREKRGVKLRRCMLLLVQHHTGVIELYHPAYSPDLAPSDYHLFSNLMSFLHGRSFETDDEAIMTVNHYLESLNFLET